MGERNRTQFEPPRMLSGSDLFILGLVIPAVTVAAFFLIPELEEFAGKTPAEKMDNAYRVAGSIMTAITIGAGVVWAAHMCEKHHLWVYSPVAR